MGCGVNCFTLNARFPDLRALGNDYVVKNITNISACRPYADPGAPGPSANLLIDDRYSGVLTLPFSFPFYGTPYNSLIASTNGFVSFDISKTGTFSHYDDLGNLPNGSYDAALIMGPYHDLDPSETTSPTQQIKYQVFGAAPNRKWILSFYKVPLYDCPWLIENTHQIVLHESTGIIEVQITDKQTCGTWNAGRAMIGLQNFAKTQGIMAPNRRMTDPPWGTIGMNETWQFIPTGGAPLYRRVELLDGTGATIAVGDTTRVDASTFEVNFPNICPPSNVTALYVVKTTYAKLSDPTTTTYSLDTIRVLRNAMPASSSAVSTTCGANVGSITVTATGGTAPLSYTLNPGAITNGTGVFNGLGQGTYTILVRDATGSCTNTLTQLVDVVGNLTGTFTRTNTSCPGLDNGSITVTPTSGTAPYSYSANGGASQGSNIFTNLAQGSYIIEFTDALGCTGTVNVFISEGSSISATSTSVATSCAGANNGSITVNGSGGVAPYTYALDGGAAQPGNTFTGLAAGPHSILVQDSRGCTVTISRTVTAGSGLIGSIFQTAESCPGANNGSVTLTPTTGTAPFSFRLDGGPAQPTGVFLGLAAGLHSVVFTDANGCTGSRSINVGAGASTSTPGITTNTSCPGARDGVITITPVPGAVYTLNPGALTNTTGIFTGLGSGTYTATYTVPPTTCIGSVTPANLVIAAGPAIAGTATTTPTSCPTVSDGRITVTNPTTAGTTYTLNPGAISNTTGIFTGLAANTYTISFVTASGCTGNVSPNPVVAAGPTLTSTFTQVNPVCAGLNNGSISITPQASSTAPYNVTLTGPGGPYTLSGAAPVTFTGLAPGVYNYSFASANGCAGTGTPVTLTTNTPILVPPTLTMPLCNGNANGTVTFNPIGGVAPYRYSADLGVTFQASNLFTGLAVGNHRFIIRDNVGCLRDTTVTLTQPAVLTATASSNATAGCSNNDGAITATATGGTAPYTYTLSGASPNTTGANTGIFTGVPSGSYTVTARDANGCTAPATVTVVLVDNMFLTLGADTTICVESSVTFSPQTNPETSIFIWSSPDAPLSTLDNPAIKNARATPTDTARYILRAQWGTCVRQDTILVNVLHKPIPNAGKDTAICDLSYAILRGSASNLSGTVNFAWSPTTNVEFPTQASTRVYPAGNDTTYIYTLTVTDNYGCKFSVTDQVAVRVQPPVPAFAGNDTTAIKGIPHQLFGSGGTSYMWTPSFPLNSPFNKNPLATLNNDTKFVLQVTDVAGCIGYDTVFVKVYVGPTYYIPNAFSPNGDGQNDVFRAIPVGIVSTEWFRIFNRYGELVFQTNQWLKGWDGTYKGKKQPVAGYIWVIKGKDRDGKTVEMKGTVMLIQ